MDLTTDELNAIEDALDYFRNNHPDPDEPPAFESASAKVRAALRSRAHASPATDTEEKTDG